MHDLNPKRLVILDTPINCVTMNSALAFVDRAVREGSHPAVVMAINPEKVYALRADANLMAFAQSADLLIPDGIGIVWAARVLFGERISRVAGADLMQEICAQAPNHGWKIFLYGSSEEVNRGAAEILQKRHPGLKITGRANGFVPPEEMDGLVDQINQSGADILFLGLGSPRQEQWIQRYMPVLNVRIIQGIGGTLDTITGRVPRAPLLFRKCHLEWFYRLLRQPSRIGRQWKLVRFAIEVLRADRQHGNQTL